MSPKHHKRGESKEGGQEQGQEGAERGRQGTRGGSRWRHKEDLEAIQVGQEEIITLFSLHTSNTEVRWHLCRKRKGEGGATVQEVPPHTTTGGHSDIDTSSYPPTVQ